jgi:hypothetical protein
VLTGLALKVCHAFVGVVALFEESHDQPAGHAEAEDVDGQ